MRKVKVAEERMVQFNRHCSPYLAGERAKFGAAQAAKLVAGTSPIGFYVKKNEKGEWVRDIEGEENATETSAEQTGENGSSGDQTGAGTGTGQGAEDNAGAGSEKRSTGRRARAKL